ncbi:MAG: hypothetical protein SGJ15_00625 [Bacteroidota bacterium]|nr:hypothetical protein [Bacteroidota bacterium]
MLDRQFLNSRFNLLFFVIAILSFVIVVIRAKTTPFTHDETATFYYFIQNGHYMPFHAHLDTNNHILNSMFTHWCYVLMGSSKFALRIPNLIFFTIMLFGLFRICKHLRSDHAKLLLLFGFVVSYNWLTFFSVSRGYGISFGAFIMAVSFLLDYFKNSKIKHFVFLCFWMQLAMAASLIMMPVFCIMLGLIVLYQLVNSKFFSIVNLLNLAINATLILYWVNFSSYLKEEHGLTHGAGESYWQVTFVTLIYMVTGSYSQILQGVLVGFTSILVLTGIAQPIKTKTKLKTLLSEPHFWFLSLFIFEMLGIYLMKKLMGINYPEDRTALFFYATLILYTVFLLDKMNNTLLHYFSILLCTILLVNFAMKLNFRKHELYIYDTFPSRFYDKLLQEQKNYPLPITIGGHRCREFIYGFMNYRSDGALNAMDAPELLHMNADYLVAKVGEKPFYDAYYTELDSEPDWNFKLLKRRDQITNKLELELKDKRVKGNGEFYEMLNDTNNHLLPNKNPIRVDFIFKTGKVPVPFEAWLVVQIDNMDGSTFCFKRSSLNWIKKDYLPTGEAGDNTKGYVYSVITPPLPKQYKCFKVFLWNIKQEEIDITFTSIKLYQLYGKGINYIAPIYF